MTILYRFLIQNSDVSQRNVLSRVNLLSEVPSGPTHQLQ